VGYTASRGGLAAVEAVAGGLELVDVAGDPEPEGQDVLEEFDAKRGDGVLDARGDFHEHGAGGEAVALELAEGFGEGFLADAFDLLEDAGEAQGCAGGGENVHDPTRPFVGDVSDEGAGGGVFGVSEGVAERAGFFGGEGIRHGRLP